MHKAMLVSPILLLLSTPVQAQQTISPRGGVQKTKTGEFTNDKGQKVEEWKNQDGLTWKVIHRADGKGLDSLIFTEPDGRLRTLKIGPDGITPAVIIFSDQNGVISEEIYFDSSGPAYHKLYDPGKTMTVETYLGGTRIIAVRQIWRYVPLTLPATQPGQERNSPWVLSQVYELGTKGLSIRKIQLAADGKTVTKVTRWKPDQSYEVLILRDDASVASKQQFDKYGKPAGAPQNFPPNGKDRVRELIDPQLLLDPGNAN